MKQFDTVLCYIIFHHIIYVPGSEYNEILSADRAECQLFQFKD